MISPSGPFSLIQLKIDRANRGILISRFIACYARFIKKILRSAVRGSYSPE
jgi:hypothetical protein